LISIKDETNDPDLKLFETADASKRFKSCNLFSFTR